MRNLLNILFFTSLSGLSLASTATIEPKSIHTPIMEPRSFENLELQRTQTIDYYEIFKKDSKEEIKRVLNIKNPSKLGWTLTNKYYKFHDYQTFFVNKDGIKPIAYSLLEVIKDDQVLKPNIDKLFDFNKIELQLSKANPLNLEELIKTDFLLVSTYHKYMTYLSEGIINWRAFQKKLKILDKRKEIIANWRKYNVKKDFRTLLYKAVDENDIFTAINEVNYTFPKAKELANLIKEYEKIAQDGGYTKIPFIKKAMKKGNYYKEIKLLRERLLQSKDLKNNECIIVENEEETQFKKEAQIELVKIDKDTAIVKLEENSVEAKDNCQELFDENVFEAVKTFQKNHGLEEDGIVGKDTIKRLNIPIETKIKKMRINLERMRWMPRELGEKYLLVNIPDYHLRVYKEGQKELEMAVVVGEKRHPTPIFSHNVSSVVLNPYWRIPQRIVRREIIPKLVEDPEYLDKNEIKAFENWSHKSTEFDVSGVDWSMYLDNHLIGNTKSAPMRFIQIPGEKNPLGRMKFLFPNKYSVYLHDTPFKRFFKYRKRAFSHGCIRLEEPNELLKAIAQEEERINYDRTQQILSDIEKTDFNLKNKIPVHIIYLTTWIDDEGNIQFRDDIYNYDKMQGKLLYNMPL